MLCCPVSLGAVAERCFAANRAESGIVRSMICGIQTLLLVTVWYVTTVPGDSCAEAKFDNRVGRVDVGVMHMV